MMSPDLGKNICWGFWHFFDVLDLLVTLTDDTQANEILGMVPPLVEWDVSSMVSASCLPSISATHSRTSRVPQSGSHSVRMTSKATIIKWAFGMSVNSKSYNHHQTTIYLTRCFIFHHHRGYHAPAQSAQPAVSPRTTSGCTHSASRPEDFAQLYAKSSRNSDSDHPRLRT